MLATVLRRIEELSLQEQFVTPLATASQTPDTRFEATAILITFLYRFCQTTTHLLTLSCMIETIFEQLEGIRMSRFIELTLLFSDACLLSHALL